MQYNGSYGYSQESILLNVDSISQVTDQLTSIKNKLMNINSEYRSAVNHYSIVSSSISTNSVSSQLDNAVYLSERTSHQLVTHMDRMSYLDKSFAVQTVQQTLSFSIDDMKAIRKKIANPLKLYNKAMSLTSNSGLMFYLSKSKGVIKLKNFELPMFSKSIDAIKKNLNIDLGDRFKWNRTTVNKLGGKGINLYKTNGDLTKNGQKFVDADFKDLSDAISDWKLSKVSRGLKTAKTQFAKSLNILDDFKISKYKDLKTAGKLGKGLGALGTVLTIGSNFHKNFYENGEFKPSWEGLEECALESTVDIVYGATATATGAFLGSFIVPPVGTVVGAAAGMVISKGLYTPWGEPPRSIVERTKGFVNDNVDKLQKLSGQAIEAIGDELSNMAESVGNGIDHAKEAVSGFVSNLFW